MWRSGVLATLFACGRLGFDSVPAGDASDRDADGVAVDTAPLTCDPIPCNDSPRTTMCGTRCLASCEETMTQPVAKARCAAWGGALVSIHDAAEQACIDTQIANLISVPLFMGYEQATQAQPAAMAIGWSWNDGSPVTAYTNWFSSEPNDSDDNVENGEEQCSTLLGGGRWNDEECGQVRGLVCAR